MRVSEWDVSNLFSKWLWLNINFQHLKCKIFIIYDPDAIAIKIFIIRQLKMNIFAPIFCLGFKKKVNYIYVWNLDSSNLDNDNNNNFYDHKYTLNC